MAQQPTILMIYCPCPDSETASELAKSLLAAKIVACANLLAPMQSHYWWNDALTESQEIPLLLKTLPEFRQEIEQHLHNHHPYSIPAIISWEVTSTMNFIKWVEENTKSIASPRNMQ